MHRNFGIIEATVLFVGCCLSQANGICTFSSKFANTIWFDNTKGTLTFTSTRMTGWRFTSYRSALISSVSSWQCHNNTYSSYLVLRTQSTFLFQRDNSNVNVYGYLCMELTNLTDVSFSYYQRSVQQPNLGGERIFISTLGTLTMHEVCDMAVDIPTLDFHVLVKSGFILDAAITCPDAFLFSADYYVTSNNGNTSCTNSNDMWDTCTNTSQMAFNYSTCNTMVMFSAGGKVVCASSVYSGGYTYTVVVNRDASITSTTRRFACLSTDGTFVSVAPGNCTVAQTPYDFPKAANQTALGQLLRIGTKYASCGAIATASSEEVLTSGEVAAIVISILILTFTFLCTCAMCCCLGAIAYVMCIALFDIKQITFTPSSRSYVQRYVHKNSLEPKLKPFPKYVPMSLLLFKNDKQLMKDSVVSPDGMKIQNGILSEDCVKLMDETQ